MRALHLSTRLHGTDGVSLEANKVAKALEGFGFENFTCAGEIDASDPKAHCLPQMHFQDTLALELATCAFNSKDHDPSLVDAIDVAAAELTERLHQIVEEIKPDLLVMQNVWAIPMQLPLAKALANITMRTGVPCLSHEHDYPWERERFSVSRIPEFIETYFPYDAANIRHLCINTPAQHELYRRRGLHAQVLPNVMDFANPAPRIDKYNHDFRQVIDVTAEQKIFLQPTRVISRKGIELAIDLLAELNDANNILVITHHAGDEGLEYLRKLECYANERAVDLRYVADHVANKRIQANAKKIYGLWDAYPHADFVTYPSLYEGFGNALLETIYFRKPALVNRYSVYTADIAPKGFRFVETDGMITLDAVQYVAELLTDAAAQKIIVDHNYALAEMHYSLRQVQRVLLPELRSLGFTSGPA